MNKLQQKITNVNLILLSLVLVFYAIIRFQTDFLRTNTAGDEYHYLKYFKIYLNDGYYVANVSGNSTLFNIVSSFINFFIDNPLLSLKTVSFISGVLCFIVLIKILNMNKRFNFYQKSLIILIFLNILIIPGILNQGINDVMLYFFTILIFYFLKKFNINEDSYKMSFSIGICFAAMFLTRKMTILYIIPFLFLFFQLHYKQFQTLNFIGICIRFLKNTGIVLICTLVFLSIFNYPSLKDKQQFSFMSKEPPQEVKVNWTQMQYLSMILVKKGELEYGQHISWDYTRKYLEENGLDSLPKNNIESISFDIGATLKQFIFNIFYQIKPITRLLGILFILYLFFKIKGFTKEINFLNWDSILIFFTIYLLTLCFIIFSMVEPRWYLNILLLLPIPLVNYIYKFKSENNKKWFDFLFINTQLIFLILVNLPYIIKNL